MAINGSMGVVRLAGRIGFSESREFKMEFPLLLSALLHEDCTAQVPTCLPRIRALALANGTNAALTSYIDYFERTHKLLDG
jgi:hypothetical protein